MSAMIETLIARGMQPRHARKAEQLLADPTRSSFSQVLQMLISLPRSHPDGAIVGLIGDRGRGKTQVAACVMAEWVRCRIGSVRYIRFAELCMRFRDAIKTGTETLTLMDFQGEPGQSGRSLLVIDEMDKRADTEHERRTLNTLIDGRYGFGRYTLLIGNDTAEGLMEAVGPTIGSRMHESGGIRPLNGPNYREDLS